MRTTAVERVDSRQHVTARAPIVLGEVDFNPWKPATLDGVEWSPAAEGGERRREPLADGAREDQSAHLFDKPRRTRRPELADADVLAVGLGGGDRLRDLHYLSAPDTYLHLLIGVDLGPSRADQERILVGGGQQIGQQLFVEEHIAVEDD